MTRPQNPSQPNHLDREVAKAVHETMEEILERHPHLRYVRDPDVADEPKSDVFASAVLRHFKRGQSAR